MGLKRNMILRWLHEIRRCLRSRGMKRLGGISNRFLCVILCCLLSEKVGYTQSRGVYDAGSTLLWMRSFWGFLSIPHRRLFVLSSLLLAIWLLGGCFLGRLFLIFKISAIMAVRWGLFAGILAWLLCILCFIGMVLRITNPLPFVVIFLATLGLSAFLLLGVFRPHSDRGSH